MMNYALTIANIGQFFMYFVHGASKGGLKFEINVMNQIQKYKMINYAFFAALMNSLPPSGIYVTYITC